MLAGSDPNEPLGLKTGHYRTDRSLPAPSLRRRGPPGDGKTWTVRGRSTSMDDVVPNVSESNKPWSWYPSRNFRSVSGFARVLTSISNVRSYASLGGRTTC
jgi:hypothetical protein